MTIPSISSYRMPAEWHPHGSTLLSWPVNPETWPDERLERVEKVYLEIIKVLSQYEMIHLLVHSEILLSRVRILLGQESVNMSNIRYHKVNCNDVWARDFGPIFIRNEGAAGTPSEFALTDWGYNAWGGKYPPYDDDNAIPKYFAKTFETTRFEPGMILEGGSIETNGDGVMLVTESVLLNPNRNPDLTKQEIEANLKYWLGQEKVIWLGRGLEGDDTDGHIDDLSRFLNKNTIMTMITDDPSDINYEALHENLEILKNATDQYGNPFNIELLPMPTTKIEGTTVDGSEYVPASYANYYVANGVVLLPLYDERYDEMAINLMKKYFPDRQVVGIDCRNLVWGQGSIHCITQQMYGF